MPRGNNSQGSVLKRFNAWVERLRASEGGKAFLVILGVILTAISLIPFIIWLPDLADDVFLFLNGPRRWFALAIVLLAVMTILVFAPSQNREIKIVGFLLAVLMAIPFVLAKTVPQALPLVVVYDASQPEIHPDHVDHLAFSELGKLAEVKKINSSTIFFSTVHKPSHRWKRLLDNGFTSQVPILSLQEVLDDSEEAIIDVSFSSFAHELTGFVSKHVQDIDSIVVFFERNYGSEQAILHDRIVELDASVTVTSTTFERSTNTLRDLEGATIIYLGSPNNLGRFMALADEHNFNLLLLPNWLRPAMGLVPERKEGNKVVVLSSIFNKITMADSKQWKRLFDLAGEAVDKGADVQAYVVARHFNEKRLVEVRY